MTRSCRDVRKAQPSLEVKGSATMTGRVADRRTALAPVKRRAKGDSVGKGRRDCPHLADSGNVRFAGEGAVADAPNHAACE